MGNSKLVEDALVFAVVAGVGIEASHEVQLAGATPLDGLALGQGLQNGKQHGIITVYVRSAERRCVGMGHEKARRNAPLLPRVLDERADVVAYDLGHARGENRNHAGLVQRVGVFQCLMQVILPPEHGSVFAHGRRDRRRRFAKMAIERRPVVRGTTL